MEVLAFRNFMGFILAGFFLTFGALCVVACFPGLGDLYFVLASSGAVRPRAIANVNSSALNFIGLFYGSRVVNDKYIFRKHRAVNPRHA